LLEWQRDGDPQKKGGGGITCGWDLRMFQEDDQQEEKLGHLQKQNQKTHQKDTHTKKSFEGLRKGEQTAMGGGKAADDEQEPTRSV